MFEDDVERKDSGTLTTSILIMVGKKNQVRLRTGRPVMGLAYPLGSRLKSTNCVENMFPSKLVLLLKEHQFCRKYVSYKISGAP